MIIKFLMNINKYILFYSSLKLIGFYKNQLVYILVKFSKDSLVGKWVESYFFREGEKG